MLNHTYLDSLCFYFMILEQGFVDGGVFLLRSILNYKVS